MKIVSFPHYTCGGLLCDILNNTFSPVAPNGGIRSLQHSLGKIGDTSGVNKDFDIDSLLSQIKSADQRYWIGTHCWLGNYVDRFENIINITTTTYNSKLYRWSRAYNLYFKKLDHWLDLQGIDLKDQMRETAKNYFDAFDPIVAHNVVNIEFADVVEDNQQFVNIAGPDRCRHLDRWKTVNKFLYAADFWQSDCAKRFYEAEYEITQQQYYVYE